MDINELKNIVALGESQSLEFKKSTTQLKSAFETVCAFLNRKGGIVLIGVDNNGKLIGQNVTDNTRQELAREMRKLEPNISLDVEYFALSDAKQIIIITSHDGKHAPYTYEGRAFQRNQSTTSRMTQHAYEQLLVERGQLNHVWEEATAEGYTIDDLEHEEIYKTIADGVRENRIPASSQRDSVEEILNRLNLLIDGNPKFAAIVLYAKHEPMKLMHCMIKMARFSGNDKLGDFIDNQQSHGNVFKLLADADAFIKRHLPIASSFHTDQFKRIDKPALPIMAIREALINAVCHRDYSDRSTDISLAIFDNRLEIWNSGSLSRRLTIQDLKQSHISVLRNKLIANVFHLRGLIEKWGIGTNKMIDLCQAEGLPEPDFEEQSQGLLVTFKFKSLLRASDTTSEAKQALSVRQAMIMRILHDSEPMSANEIYLKIDNPLTLRTLKADLSTLKKLGLIEQVGKAKSTLWKVVG